MAMGECSDVHGRVISPGIHYVPGPDSCTLCICENGQPKWCKAVLCSPPQECRSFRVGSSCCEFICLDGAASAAATRDLLVRVCCFVFALGLLVTLALLLRRCRRDRRRLPPHHHRTSLASIRYIGGSCEEGTGAAGWKPGRHQLPSGEAPPPYEEAISQPRADLSTNMTAEYLHHRTYPVTGENLRLMQEYHTYANIPRNFAQMPSVQGARLPPNVFTFRLPTGGAGGGGAAVAPGEPGSPSPTDTEEDYMHPMGVMLAPSCPVPPGILQHDRDGQAVIAGLQLDGVSPTSEEAAEYGIEPGALPNVRTATLLVRLYRRLEQDRLLKAMQRRERQERHQRRERHERRESPKRQGDGCRDRSGRQQARRPSLTHREGQTQQEGHNYREGPERQERRLPTLAVDKPSCACSYAGGEAGDEEYISECANCKSAASSRWRVDEGGSGEGVRWGRGPGAQTLQRQAPAGPAPALPATLPHAASRTRGEPADSTNWDNWSSVVPDSSSEDD